MTQAAISCKLHIRPMGDSVRIAALGQVVSRCRRPAILGGNNAVEGYSLFAAEPVEVASFHVGQHDPFLWLEQTLNRYRFCESSGELSADIPYPGWIGYFSYDLCRCIESVPSCSRDDLQMPLMDLAFYDAVIVYDHRTGRTWLSAVEFSGQPETMEQKFARLESWIKESQSLILELPPAGDRVDNSQTHSGFKVNMTQEEYFASLAKIHQYIIDGDVYQINFSQRFECSFQGDPSKVFLWQSTYNPSPYAAYLAAGDWAVVSASPELFLRIDGRDILTRPIKGTRPRRACACNDESKAFNLQQEKDLHESDKDKAELAMIVDLERNDLARVCVPGTRYVKRDRVIEAYPTVFHAFGEIAGTLPRSNDPALFCDILRATFPGGSITGAPKVRAMEIIEQLEPTRRGVYCGSIGYIGLNFRTTLNIAIRTIVFKSGRAFVQVGGGIVADSSPQAEWQETLTKAKALLQSVTTCRA